jgi:hypothetical protein
MLNGACKRAHDRSCLVRVFLCKGNRLNLRKNRPVDKLPESLDLLLKRIAHDRSRADYARYLNELRADAQKTLNTGATAERALDKISRAELSRQSKSLGARLR